MAGLQTSLRLLRGEVDGLVSELETATAAPVSLRGVVRASRLATPARRIRSRLRARWLTAGASAEVRADVSRRPHRRLTPGPALPAGLEAGSLDALAHDAELHRVALSDAALTEQRASGVQPTDGRADAASTCPARG